jgi:dihydroorotate dehydrogenase (fumarate)/dihydroorotate dehydrogenase
VSLYRRALRPLLFRTDAEWMHGCAIRAGAIVSGSASACARIAAWCAAAHPRLAMEIAGVRFASPLGLAAGFDKSARAVPALGALGFSHVEVGSISADPSSGNPKPRLFRVPAEQALIVNYGLPNDGAEAIAQRLAATARGVPLGINIVSTNRGAAQAEPDGAVIDDYVRALARLQPLADYLCLNLSCPNTREGRGFFHDVRRLSRLLDAIGSHGVDKPLFLKVAPFAGDAELDAFLAAVAPAPFVTGFSTNLPPGNRPGMPGAVAGKPCAALADQAIRQLYRRMDRGRYRIIGSGGVFCAEDAYRKIRLGASLVQLMSALVYEGPGVVKRIVEGLAQLVERDGFARVTDAVGVDALQS